MTSLAIAACLAALGCSTAPPPPLPAGIAELYLPRDSRTLARIAVEEDPTGSITRRREVLTDVSRQLLMAPPSDALIPELFDLLTAVAPRMEGGAISPAWGSYIYTTYQQDMLKDRPTGSPRWSGAEVEKALDGYVVFFRLRAREGRKPRTIEDAAFEDTRSWAKMLASRSRSSSIGTTRATGRPRLVTITGRCVRATSSRMARHPCLNPPAATARPVRFMDI